jgi:YegS/Rv2252/BmrU family lipid kinase
LKILRFIVNPFSGTARKKDFGELVSKHINKEKYTFDVIKTEYANHAKELAIQAKNDNVDIIVGVGGDGTINEIASQLVETNSALAIIPGGSGNGFGTYIGMSRDIVKSIKLLDQSSVRQIDTGICNGQFFINIAGLGFDAQVAYALKSKTLRGFMGYLLMTIKELFSYRSVKATISFDEHYIEGDFASIVVANAPIYGYGFNIAPFAKLDDGYLELVLIKHVPIYKYIINIPKYFNGRIHECDFIEFHKTKAINIQSHAPTFYHLDGEGHDKGSTFQFLINPKSLYIFAP